jgi:hypothetical protein
MKLRTKAASLIAFTMLLFGILAVTAAPAGAHTLQPYCGHSWINATLTNPYKVSYARYSRVGDDHIHHYLARNVLTGSTHYHNRDCGNYSGGKLIHTYYK